MPIGTIQHEEGRYITVKVEREDMCGECHACDVITEKKQCELKCLNLCKGKVGDVVEIDLEQDLFLRATAIIYGIPLIGLFVGIFMGPFLFSSINETVKDFLTIGLGFGLMTLSFLTIKIFDKKEKYNKLLPVAKKIVNERN